MRSESEGEWTEGKTDPGQAGATHEDGRNAGRVGSLEDSFLRVVGATASLC
jgi:hypothetical protein